MSDKTEFWSNLGQGICIFLLCFGIGTCSALVDGNIKINVGTKIEEKK